MQHFIRSAEKTDISRIMNIESASFPSDIQENKDVFLDRITTFPQGTFLYFESEHTKASGYFSSEIWETLPPALPEYYSLGHKASERHSANGTVLYISSFAVLPSSRGGTGRFLFKESISNLCTQFPSLNTIVFIVHETWLAARYIYETEGFAYTGILPGFFTSPINSSNTYTNALIMEKKV